MTSIRQESYATSEPTSDLWARSKEASPEIVFDVRNLSVRYGQKVALRDVNLQISQGSVTALVGPSGCGKSTFLSVLNRMCDTVSSCEVQGEVQFRGRNLNDPHLDVAQLRRQVGIIFQKPAPFPFSIWRNLEMPLKEHGVRSNSEIKSRIEKGLRDVGLWDEVAQNLHGPALNLSGGQQQRLCLARTLVLRPDVLLMDEPCSALDPFATMKIEALIASLRDSYTVIIVTHNLAQARRVSDYCVMFWCDGDSGCVVESGPTQKMFDAPQELLTERFFGGCVG